MTQSILLHTEAAFVTKLNQIFYDVEAEQYDERHPEVVQGDARWWTDRGAGLISTLRDAPRLRSGLRIVDVGCGTGFIPSLLSAYLGDGDLVVGVDQSEGMLRR